MSSCKESLFDLLVYSYFIISFFTFPSPFPSRSHRQQVNALRLVLIEPITFFSDVEPITCSQMFFSSPTRCLRSLFAFQRLHSSLDHRSKISDAIRRIANHPLWRLFDSLKQWTSLLARIWCQCAAQREESSDK